MHPALVDRPVILFDFFHTLSCVEAVCPEVVPTWAALGVAQEAWDAVWWTRHGEDRATGAVRDVAGLLAATCRELVPAVDAARIATVVAARRAKFAAAMRRIEPAVLATLARLRAAGKRLGLVSNADHMEIEAWEASPLVPLLDAVVFSCRVGCAKPDAAIYRLACERLEVAPTDCVFVGDGNSRELEGARALGMVTVQQRGLLRRYHPHHLPGRGRHAAYGVETIAELFP